MGDGAKKGDNSPLPPLSQAPEMRPQGYTKPPRKLERYMFRNVARHPISLDTIQFGVCRYNRSKGVVWCSGTYEHPQWTDDVTRVRLFRRFGDAEKLVKRWPDAKIYPVRLTIAPMMDFDEIEGEQK